MFPYHDASQPTVRKLFFAGRATANGIGISHTTRSFSLDFTSNGTAVWNNLGGDSTLQGSAAVMMINRTDPIDVGTVYKFAGKMGSVASKEGRRIDLNAFELGWEPTGELYTGRAECNVVPLPNGKIAIVGGTTATEFHSHAGTAVRNIEIFDPATDTVVEVSPLFSGTRMYHSIALPTPNATILLAGGEYLPVPDSGVMKNFTGQEYYPSYFSDELVRPEIINWPRSQAWNTTLGIQATGQVAYFSLIKLGSTTHANDTTTRFIKLTPAQPPSGQFHYLKMPKNGGVAPPGQYMLFAVSTNGVPSVARYVQIGP